MVIICVMYCVIIDDCGDFFFLVAFISIQMNCVTHRHDVSNIFDALALK